MAALTPAHLLLVRHGESETNASNAFSGRADPLLTEHGRGQAKRVGQRLAERDLRPDRVFTSELRRCRQTTEIILDAAGRGGLPVIVNAALNERDYGLLTGLDKLAAAEQFGKEQVQRWRRSYAETPPGGESLQDTAARVLAYYVHVILPAALSGGTTLMVSHGNTLRALIMALDGMDAQAIDGFDVSTGSAVLYRLAADSSVIERVKLT
jgi:2,3-bisphosphoglycerate-dependent phosphoglycerate mutase